MRLLFLHPSPTSHKTFQVFLIHFPKCLGLSTIQSYAPNVALHHLANFFLNCTSNLLVKRVFFLLNASFAAAVLYLTIFIHYEKHTKYRVIQNVCRGTIVQRQFRTKFGKQQPSDNSIRRWYAQFQETGCVCIPELKVRIRTATETITADMRNELDYRVDVCRIQRATYRAPIRYVTKTWSFVLLNKKTYNPISILLCMTSCLNPENHFE